MTDLVNADYTQAVRAQNDAANPLGTRLASANAGSGKTRVLVDRVSRILLGGTPPDKILCLTYTKAAAAEMQSRLFEKLGAWSIMAADRLRKELTELSPHLDIDLPVARALFAQALETPDGLKVQTIHAFCERILSRFPVEAGILPGFEALDEADILDLRAHVRDEILRAAHAAPDGALNRALQTLTLEMADTALDDLFKWMSGNAQKILHWQAMDGISDLKNILGLTTSETVQDLNMHFWAETPLGAVRDAARSMLAGSKTEVVRGEAILAALDMPDPSDGFPAYAAVFMNASGAAPLKSIITKKAPEPAASLFDPEGAEVARVLAAVETLKAAKTFALTEAIYILAVDYADRFARAKRARRGLDFDDQIMLVKTLLQNSEVSDWVRYKLDGGVAHILVDEAQDTSPDQWAIIDVLAEPFFAGNPEEQTPRTLFAVGDEKQSIYSFQGARPEKFLEKIQTYSGKPHAKEVRMNMSFRSAPDILRCVDQVFVENGGRLRMFDAQSYAPAADRLRHTAKRTDRGLVELWPLAPRPEKVEDSRPWDTTPVDALSRVDSREQLALEIAKTIKYWIDMGEPVYDRKRGVTRPMQAGDILILVQSRNAFFDAVIRNLKSVGVAVAGADRLKLRDALVVKDLMSLARFVLLPADDLSLAELLKSPLFGFSEDELFAVAKGREKETLWTTLKTRRPDVAEILKDILGFSYRYAPYEFFARILALTDKQGNSFRKRIFTRLGLEAKEALEAFLAKALIYQRRHAPSLQHFVQDFASHETDIKRDMDAGQSEGAGEVRVMTVHGAKGLEAPVVFLPDTVSKPQFKTTLLGVGGTGYAWLGSAATRPCVLEPYVTAAQAAKSQENLRLLYVAMTRAESRLVLCGYWQGRLKTGYSEGSWYHELTQAFDGLETEPCQTPFGDGLCFGAAADPAITAPVTPLADTPDMPDWLYVPAAPEGLPYRKVTPSHLWVMPAIDPPVRSPLSHNADRRFARGNIIHKLLEILPEVALDRREQIARAYLDTQNVDDPTPLLNEVFAVLNAPEFAEIFAPAISGQLSMAEVSLAGRAKRLPKGLYLNGQIDRLRVTQSHVYIIDYKSNRPPPYTQDGVADIYWAQMAAYRELAREIYPHKEVVCALLWTDGPRLMVLDSARLDDTLTGLGRLPT